MRNEPRAFVLSHEKSAGEGQRGARHGVAAGYHETTHPRQERRQPSSLILLAALDP
jgi:hypothetical protein